jgi:hypothetical protein
MQQTTERSDVRREVARLAIGAAVISFLLPLLPLYGRGSGFAWSLGIPLRGLITFFLGWWTNAAVVAVGILFLRRDLIGAAGGVFVALALILGMTITGVVIDTAPHFGHWQGTSS